MGSIVNKLLVWVALCCFGFVAGYQWSAARVKPITIETVRTEVVEKEVVKWKTQVVVKDVVRTVTVKPDGTKITESHSVTKSDVKSAERETGSMASTRSDSATIRGLPNWSLGVRYYTYDVTYGAESKYQYLREPVISLSGRVAGSVWLEYSFDLWNRVDTLGVRIEF